MVSVTGRRKNPLIADNSFIEIKRMGCRASLVF
jgi:hypothetical protein